MTLSKYQHDIFDWIKSGEGNAIVQARAGSGKTTTALHAMNSMKGSVISMTLNKKNAVELQTKIQQMGMVHAKGSTFHAEGFANIKKAHGFVKVDNYKVNNLVEGYTLKPEQYSARSFIKGIVSMAKQSGFGCEDCPSISDTKAWIDIAMHYDITLDSEMSMEECIEIAKDVLRDSNRNVKQIDFDDMVYLPILHNLNLIKYDWIIVDEAQDTNVIRKIMVKRMMKA
jgi:superfamily I DNA/RNA helicase